jgi:hypothetical protein
VSNGGAAHRSSMWVTRDLTEWIRIHHHGICLSEALVPSTRASLKLSASRRRSSQRATKRRAGLLGSS